MSAETKAKFEIFRKETSPTLEETGHMVATGLVPTVVEGLERAFDAGLAEGVEIRVLHNTPGFSLVYSWFKSGFPLPLHSHSADCLYFIQSGSLKLGTEILGAGDGFFVPAGTPYTYTPGEEGLEILEFRQKGDFDIRYFSKNATFWNKAVETVGERRGRWAEERPLSARAS